MLGREVNAKRPVVERRARLLFSRYVGGMIIEDELDRGAGRISGVEMLEEFDELSAAVAVSDERMDLPVSRSIPANRLSVPCVCTRNPREVAWTPGTAGKSGAVVAMAWIPGFSS